MDHRQTIQPKQFFSVYLLVFSLVFLSGYYWLRMRYSDRFYEAFETPAIRHHPGFDLEVVLRGAKSVLARSDKVADYKVGHPPMEIALLLPLTFLKHHQAHFLFGAVLIAVLFLTVFICLRIYGQYGVFFSLLTSSLLTATLFHSYPVLFALERGNTDIVAGFFMGLFVFSMMRQKAWLSGLSLILAVHIKLYPVILAPFFFCRFGVRKTFGLVLGLVAGFFVLGKLPFQAFYSSIGGLQNRPYVWEGNHSLVSWVRRHQGLASQVGLEAVDWIRAALLLAISWGLLGCVRMVKKRKDFEQYETVVLCMTFPLMSLLPGTSHDYRLPIFIIPFLLLIANTELQEQKDRGMFLVGALLISFTTALLLSPRSFFLYKTEALLVQFVIYGLLAAKIKWGILREKGHA